jgi:hypothetical protein
MDGNVTDLKTDKQKADDYRSRIVAALADACKLMDEAKANGLIIAFGLNPDQYGRTTVQNLTIVKPL